MLRVPTGILTEIVARKRQELESLLPLAGQFERAAHESIPGRRPFDAALRAHTPAIIAEVKKASPSKGLLQADFDPPSIALAYQAGGAACLSVLTDHHYFQGSLADLEAARDAVRLPVLRKDFTIHPVQILEAGAHGADAILLIAAILSFKELLDFRELATSLGLAALVEVHDAAELAKAVDCGAAIIGVNNRNLETFEVSLETSLALASQIPSGVLSVSESGIHTRADLDLLRAAGYSAFLVGESLMKSETPEALLKALLQ
jgi:indole-3-glycerol phosphate synthase